MTTPRFLSTLGLLCFFAASPARSAETTPPGTIAVDVCFLLWSDPVETSDTPSDQAAPSLPVWTFPSEKNRPAKVELTPAVATARQRYLGPEQLTFYREKPAARPGDPPLLEPVARATLPPGWSGVLFIVTPAPAGSPLPWQLYPVREDEQTLPWENLRLHNVSRTPVILRLGSHETTLAPGADLLWPYLPAENGQPLLLAAKVGDAPQRVFTGYLATLPSTRKQVFLLPAPGTPHLWRMVEIVDHR